MQVKSTAFLAARLWEVSIRKPKLMAVVMASGHYSIKDLRFSLGRTEKGQPDDQPMRSIYFFGGRRDGTTMIGDDWMMMGDDQRISPHDSHRP